VTMMMIHSINIHRHGRLALNQNTTTACDVNLPCSESSSFCTLSPATRWSNAYNHDIVSKRFDVLTRRRRRTATQ